MYYDLTFEYKYPVLRCAESSASDLPMQWLLELAIVPFLVDASGATSTVSSTSISTEASGSHVATLTSSLSYDEDLRYEFTNTPFSTSLRTTYTNIRLLPRLFPSPYRFPCPPSLPRTLARRRLRAGGDSTAPSPSHENASPCRSPGKDDIPSQLKGRSDSTQVTPDWSQLNPLTVRMALRTAMISHSASQGEGGSQSGGPGGGE